jgi:hypothetical protein
MVDLYRKLYQEGLKKERNRKEQARIAKDNLIELNQESSKYRKFSKLLTNPEKMLKNFVR